MTTITESKPVTWRDKLAEAKKLLDRAGHIVSDKVPDGDDVREATAEEKNLVESLMEDAKQYKAEAAQLKELEALAADIPDLADDDDAEPDDIERKQHQRQGKVKQHRPGDGEFKDWAEFLEAVWMAQASSNRWVDPRLSFMKYDDAAVNNVKSPHTPRKAQGRKDLGESAGATGGFLVPTEFDTSLRSVMGEQSFIRQRATRIPMRRRSIRLPVLDQTGTTAGQPHWFGGMQFAWAEEAAQKTQSDPSFREITLVAHKLIGYTRASDELVEDGAISLDAFLSGPMGFAGGAVWMEEYAFLNGTGAGQPQGVINAGCTIAEGRNTANTVVFDDLADMVSKFMPSGNGVWVISQSLMSDLIQLNGPSGNASYIWQANARDGIPGMILGYPVIWTEKAPVKGSLGDIGLYDFTYYLIGDRQATTIESTKFDRWQYDQTSWRMVHRVDGQPWLSAPLTYQDGSTQISPFVVLTAAAGGS